MCWASPKQIDTKILSSRVSMAPVNRFCTAMQWDRNRFRCEFFQYCASERRKGECLLNSFTAGSNYISENILYLKNQQITKIENCLTAKNIGYIVWTVLLAISYRNTIESIMFYFIKKSQHCNDRTIITSSPLFLLFVAYICLPTLEHIAFCTHAVQPHNMLINK